MRARGAAAALGAWLGLATAIGCASPVPPAPAQPPAAAAEPDADTAGEPAVAAVEEPAVAAVEEPAAAEPPAEAAADEPLSDASLEADWLDEEGADPAARDPLEGWNRLVFGFNEGVLGWVVDPLGGGVLHIVPQAGRRAIDRFFTNLGEPVTFVNDVLQLAPVHAGRTTARFAINTTLGVAGFFDPAGWLGIARHRSDFGQTLGVWCVPSGAYLVLPLLGPTTARDSVGTLIDFVLRPDFWLLGPAPALLIYGGDQFVTYDMERERLAALRGTSVDFYAALRSAYLMDRDAFVTARRRELGRGGESP
jgi:phospholipid-binding lipoprotein MlaA